MLLRLALETSAHHSTADEDRLSALSIETVGDYRLFLSRVFGFESVVEQLVVRHCVQKAPWIERRIRSFRLRADLRALGISDSDIRALPLATTLQIPSPAHALGWMFVLERQHLVSGLLRRHVQRALGAEAEYALRYLDAVGDTPGTAFRTFGDELGQLAREHPPMKIVAGGTEAFRAQRQWYSAMAPRSRATSVSGDVPQCTVTM
jgi:heme oxygenase